MYPKERHKKFAVFDFCGCNVLPWLLSLQVIIKYSTCEAVSKTVLLTFNTGVKCWHVYCQSLHLSNCRLMLFNVHYNAEYIKEY